MTSGTTRVLLMLAMLLVGTAGARAACTDGNLHLTIDTGIALGTFTRPDAGSGSSFLTVAANGTRTIPGNLIIQSDTSIPSRMPHAGTATVKGGAGCSFKIDAVILSGDLSGVSLAPGSGYTLSSASSGATGTLDSTGTFVFTIGITQSVSDSNSQTVGGSLSVTVTYN